jgi:succinate-semialdehyde dehydrogenase/glutarate-semialdehyde dehydrogenase
MGRICIAVNRILVTDEARGPFLEALAAETARIKLGNGVEPGVAYGPVLNERVRVRIAAYVADAICRGGRLIVGGSAPKGDEYKQGFFFNPTLIDGADDGALVMTEESYGPIAAVRRVSDDAEALAVANALPHGLASYVYSRDLDRAWSFAEHIECGQVGVNVSDTTELQAPFGGWKLSGLGRELGREGLTAFRELKHIRLRLRATTKQPYAPPSSASSCLGEPSAVRLSEGCAKKVVDPRAMTPRPDRAPWRVPPALATVRESRQVPDSRWCPR